MKIKDIYAWIDAYAPFSTQAAWDNSGLLLGSAERDVTKVLVCLDVTEDAARFAVQTHCDLILSHHPVIFRPVKQIGADSVYWTLIRNDISVLCAHTNLDKAPGGVNDTFCELIGMEYEKCPDTLAEGFLNIGNFSETYSAAGLAAFLSEKLGGAVRYINVGEEIRTVAVCTGAGGEFAAQAREAGYSALITGDADHHDFLDAAAIGVSLFAAGHHETEVPIVHKLCTMLTAAFEQVEFIEYTNVCPIKTVI